MRVFYIVVFATAALFASAIARPGSKANRHERRARSTNANHYQKPLFNPDFDAVPNQWENERSDQVPPVPEFPRSDWQKYQLPESGRSSFKNQGQFIDVNDDGQNNGIDKFPDPVRHVNNNDNEHNQDLENLIDSLRLLNTNGEDDEKNTEKFIELIHHFNEDQSSQNDIEPPVHKKFYSNLGQRDNDHEVNTNNINQNFDVSGHGDQDQHRNRNQDWDQDRDEYDDDDDDDDDSTWDDDSGPDDSDDEDYDEDDSFSNESSPDDDFENDSNSIDDLYNDDSSQDVDDSKDKDDQVEDRKPPKGFNEQGSINPRTVNGSPYFGSYKLDNQLGRNNDPRSWYRNVAPRKDSYLKNECIVLCNTIKHTADNFPEINSLCQCYTGGMISNKK